MNEAQQQHYRDLFELKNIWRSINARKHGREFAWAAQAASRRLRDGILRILDDPSAVGQVKSLLITTRDLIHALFAREDDLRPWLIARRQMMEKKSSSLTKECADLLAQLQLAARDLHALARAHKFKLQTLK